MMIRDSSVSVLFYVLIAALGLIQFGYTFGYSSPTESEMMSDLGLTSSEGQLTDRTVFDSSYERGDPIELVLGMGQVIKGGSLGNGVTQLVCCCGMGSRNSWHVCW